MYSHLLCAGAVGEGDEAADHDGGGCVAGLHPPQGPLRPEPQNRLCSSQGVVMTCCLWLGLPSMQHLADHTAQLGTACKALTTPAWPGLLAHMHV